MALWFDDEQTLARLEREGRAQLRRIRNQNRLYALMATAHRWGAAGVA
jgi:hypothetical protein